MSRPEDFHGHVVVRIFIEISIIWVGQMPASLVEILGPVMKVLGFYDAVLVRDKTSQGPGRHPACAAEGAGSRPRGGNGAPGALKRYRGGLYNRPRRGRPRRATDLSEADVT